MCTSLIFPQSLAELAKKEKERRARLKGKKSVVITNADLKKRNLHPALTLPQFQPSPQAKTSPPPSPKLNPQQKVKSTSEPSWKENLDQQGPEEGSGNLEEKLKKVHEYVQLLSLKLRALWQEFYSMDDMSPRGKIKKEISETYLQLQKAQQQAQQLEEQLKKK